MKRKGLKNTEATKTFNLFLYFLPCATTLFQYRNIIIAIIIAKFTILKSNDYFKEICQRI